MPPAPSVGSAIGFLDAPVSFETVRSRYATLDQWEPDEINTLLGAMVAEATVVVRAGAPGRELRVTRTAFMRYRGQGHEIEIALPDRDLSADDKSDLVHLFEDAYRAQFSRSVPGMTVEILNWAVSVSTIAAAPVPIPPIAAARPASPSGRRQCHCDRTGAPIEMAVYQRETLRPGHRLTGPALIVEPQTTTLISAEFRVEVDGALNLILTRTEGVS